MPLATPAQPFDVAAIRAEFPALDQRVHGHPLVYLDNAATTQKPRVVLETMTRYYEEQNANVHRGVHELSERATAAYEGAREVVRSFLNARSTASIVFTRNATESINLVARAWGDANLGRDDEVLVTGMEHHSNLVPWQMACERRGAILRVLQVDERGEMSLEALDRLLSPRTKMVAVVHVSNALGTVNPVEEIARRAKQAGAAVLVDGSQALAHFPVDVETMGADFYVGTGHKVYGPMGIGVLYGREEMLDAMPPFLGGGDMIRTVTLERSTWNELPYKFEAGTPNVAGAVGLAAALGFIRTAGLEAVGIHEARLLAQATDELGALDGLRLVGTAQRKVGVLSFVLDGIHPHDIGTVLDREGVAIRTGHHCAQPLMDRLGLPATARASFAMYNRAEDVEALVAAVRRARAMLG